MINRLFAVSSINYNLFQISGLPFYFLLIFTRRFNVSMKKLSFLVLTFIFLLFSDDFSQAFFLFGNIFIAVCIRVFSRDIKILWYLLIFSCMVAYFDNFFLNSLIASYLYVNGNGTHSGILGVFELYRFGAFFSEPSRLALTTVMVLYLTHLFKVYSNSYLLIAIPIVLSTVSISGLFLLIVLSVILFLDNEAPKSKVVLLLFRMLIFIVFLSLLYVTTTILISKYGTISLLIEGEPRVEKISRALYPILRGEIFLIPGFFNYVSLYDVNVGNWLLVLVHDYRLLGIILLGMIMVSLYLKVRLLGMIFVLGFYSMQSENHFIFVAPLIWILLHEKKYIS